VYLFVLSPDIETQMRSTSGRCTKRASTLNDIQGDLSLTAGGKIDLKNYNFVFIFRRPNLLFNFGIFSIISCLIYSTLWHMHTQVFSHNFTMLNLF
jgi:hypothetical protein